MEEIKNVKNTEVNEGVEVEMTKSNEFITKVGNGIKKHGKKLLAGAIVGAVGLVGFMLGRKTGKDDEDFDYIELESDDVTDVDDSEDVD